METPDAVTAPAEEPAVDPETTPTDAAFDPVLESDRARAWEGISSRHLAAAAEADAMHEAALERHAAAIASARATGQPAPITLDTLVGEAAQHYAEYHEKQAVARDALSAL